MLDKSNYPKPKSIGETVRKGADKFFKSSLKGKNIPGGVVKRVFRRKSIKKGS